MKITHLLILAAVLVGLLSGNSLWLKHPSRNAQSFEFVVPAGASVRQIAEDLKEREVIGSVFLFKVYAALSGSSRTLQQGVFELEPGMSVRDTILVLTRAQAPNELTLTFIEGWTREEMGTYVARAGVGSVSDWDRVARPDLEGYLFPDTYRFFPDVTMEEIVERMREEFDRKVDSDLRAEIDRQGKTLHDVITMASIIEREVRGTEDRKMVSDIFWKRVAIGMGLQADSTVNYITGNDTPSISYEDREIDSPYNTYKYRGLPPGPISNPSLDSIRAAIYPTSNDYYFFLTDPEGDVHYAKTLDEHNVNRAKYIR